VFESQVDRLPKPKYEYITTEEKARTALSEIANYNAIEVDSETTSLDPYTGKMSLLQLGVPNKAYVFDVRSDTEHSSVNLELFRPLLTDKSILKLLQNAVFDMSFIKYHGGYYIENIYDTMLAEQLLYLGIPGVKASLDSLTFRYFNIALDKEPRDTFADYNQVFKPYQLEYAANDVVVLDMIRQMQMSKITQEALENACRIEFEFTKPMCEMQLNGITFDVAKHEVIMSDIQAERDSYAKELSSVLDELEDQTTMFGVSLVNIDSNVQLLSSLRKYGLDLESTDVAVLKRYKDVPIVKAILKYRKAQKFLSTYGQTLIDKINPITGRLHTNFRQMVSTGRMSSLAPNLQNIPKLQLYRSCYVAKEGCLLVTTDMSGAELRILGNLSADPLFVECYSTGQDLHTRTASEILGIPIDQVTGKDRDGAKAINFGLAYGLSKYGLAKRLGITEKQADLMITTYFKRYVGIKRLLDSSARDAVMKRYTTTIGGRRRYYRLPEFGDPDFNKQKRAVEREGKNAVIQGSNADTIKEAMIIAVNELEKRKMESKLLLTVHDEIVIEAPFNEVEEAKHIAEQSLINGFGKYFSLIPMEAEGLVGPCWLKRACEDKSTGEECGGTDMKWSSDDKYGTKIVCKKCGAVQQ
jgi:DNA polymerase I-like protein with 3'-5' exonuclease and polymerase domains